MVRWADVRQIGLLVLLLNVVVVFGAAVFRHASADDAQPPVATALPGNGTNLRTTSAQSTAGTDTDSSQSLLVPPAPSPAPITNEKRPGAGSDPVLDELRNLIRDPNSGLDMAPLEFEPTGAQASPTAQGSNRWVRLQARAESVHHIALAARKLSAEAQALAKSGATEEADVLMQRVIELHAIIQRLTTSD